MLEVVFIAALASALAVLFTYFLMER